MAVNSLTGFIGVGKQSAIDVQATTIYRLLALTSSVGVQFDEGDDLKEHPSTVAATSFAQATAKAKLGYLAPWAANFIMRPKAFPAVLQAMGFSIVTTPDAPEAGAYTHVCTAAADAAMLWMSVVHDIGGDNSFRRRLLNARGNQLNITANNTDIRCDLAGTALIEGNVGAAPTYVSEVSDQILPTIGTFTCNFDAATLTSTIRGLTCNIAQPLKDGREELPLFTSTRTSLDRQNLDITGDIQQVDADFDLWKKIIRGSTAGTNPSLAITQGDLNFKFESASPFVLATEYSVEFDFPSVYYTLPTEGVANNADDLVRVNIGWNMVADVATPVTITVINDVASY